MMNFINRYSKPDLLNYFYSEQFNEHGNTFIFSVGKTENYGLVSKVDVEGNLIWEKKFSGDKGSIIEFKKIVQVNYFGLGRLKTTYVLHTVINGTHSLVAIDGDSGDFKWANNFGWEEKNTNLCITASKATSKFFVALSSSDIESYEENLKVFSFDISGNFLKGLELTHDKGKYILNGIDSFADKIALAGKLVDEKVNAVITSFNEDIEPLNSIEIHDIECEFHDLKILEDNYYCLSGYSYNNKNVFITKFSIKDQSASYVEIEDTSDLKSKVEVGFNGSVLLTTYNKENGNVSKFSSNLNYNWSKTIQFDTGNNGINFINYKNNRLTFNCFNEVEGSMLVYTDLNLNTCKTKSFSLTTNEKVFKLINANVNKKEYNFKPPKYSIQSSVLNSVKSPKCAVPDKGGELGLLENISLQSTNFVLNAAGSTGDDGSAKGVHLRWFFDGVLGENHLPKGNYYVNENFIFNKPDDFVKIYKTVYTPLVTTIDFSLPPQVINPVQRFWIYKISGKSIYIYFNDSTSYDNALAQYNPSIDTYNFVKIYGDNLIEVECKKDLFFASSFSFDSADTGCNLLTETISVKENKIISPKIISSRGKYGLNDLNSLKIFNENCRAIRYKSTSCFVSKIHLEFYSDFIYNTNFKKLWEPIGEYSLTIDDNKALNELEPIQDSVNGKWPRYNDGETVNINNYIDKWNGTVQYPDRNTKDVVAQFLYLSTDINNPNPKGIETISFGLNIENEDGSTPEPSEDDYTDISLLDVLNIGSIDFHVARMLGLGTLDLSYDAQSGNKYVYLSEYITYGDLEDGFGEREVQHLSMSLPTSYKEERLPIPYELNQIIPGIIEQNDGEEPIMMTDEGGYTPDGKNRFITLESSPLPEEIINAPFYITTELFNQSEYSYPVFAGLEYKMNDQTSWVKPELNNDSNYKNIFQDSEGCNETIPLILPEDNDILYIHKQTESGDHHYLAYGVNIFSRSTLGLNILTINTLIKPENFLQPPNNVNALLIREESPLILTTEEEQTRREQILTEDKTLVRLTFDYNSNQELISNQIEDAFENFSDTDIEQIIFNGEPNFIYPDDKNVFAEEIEIFFRNQTPNVIEGKINPNVVNDPINEMIAILTTEPFLQASTGENLVPVIPSGNEINFIGSKLLIGSNFYFIHDIDNSGNYPILKILKNHELEEIEIVEDGYFQIVENMQNVESWNNPLNENSIVNPESFKIQIGLQNSSDWSLKREVINFIDEEGNTIRFLEKSNGFWKNAVIEEVLEAVQSNEEPDGSYTYTNAFNGIYKLTFTGFQLNQHSQYSTSNNSVEWFRGVVRLRTSDSISINGERKSFEVQRIENINNGDLILYIYDNNYPGYDADPQILNEYDSIHLGSQLVNFYPGYKVYLYQNQNINLTEEDVLPEYGEGNKYSIFGLRSHDLTTGFDDYFSRFSIPALMFAQEIAEPLKPQTPVGAKYATRPDFYGKSTYTFTTSFGTSENYKPHGVQFLRSNDEVILNSLYSTPTLQVIRESLKPLGGNDEVWLKNRWDNFFDFEGHRVSLTGFYSSFPPEEENSYALPLPDNQSFLDNINEFINWHNSNNGANPDTLLVNEVSSLNQVLIPISSGVESNVLVVDFIEQVVKNSFVPLTEIPIVYQYIKPESYRPINKKQNIRDINGYMLDPTNENFDMAPMAKRISSANNEVSFTDFTLDGTSKNIYFYTVREISNQMKMGEMSDFLGPIKLVNTNPPEAPEIKRMIPILENRVLGISSSVLFEINRYTEEQFIKKINLYRATNRIDADSIRTMKLVKVIDVENEEIESNDVWNIIDDFNDINEIPFGDPLFYRITVSRKVEYSENGTDAIIEYAPSHPSKLVATTIVENYIPDSPVLKFYSEPEENGFVNYVTLAWEKKCYNGKYHIYKMNNQGNWIKIHEVQSNNEQIYVHLEQTSLNDPNLRILSDEGDKLYHHFKVITENTAGMMSSKENILTIFNEVSWKEVGGISTDGTDGMIVSGTFRVR